MKRKGDRQGVTGEGGEATSEVAKRPAKMLRNAKKVKLEAYRLKFCRLLVDHKVAEAMPHIADKFASEAIKGSIEYARALAQMATVEDVDGPPARGGKRPKTLSEILLEEFEKPKKKATSEGGAGPKAQGGI
jgi:hypothetical protein